MFKKGKRLTGRTLIVFVVFGVIFCGLYAMRHNSLIAKNTQAAQTAAQDELERFLSGELTLEKVSDLNAKRRHLNYDAGIVEILNQTDQALAESKQVLAKVQKASAEFEKEAAKKYANTPIRTSKQLEVEKR